MILCYDYNEEYIDSFEGFKLTVNGEDVTHRITGILLKK